MKDGRPSCFNRPPFAGRWVLSGYREGDLKPRLRWVAHTMSQRCAAWDAPDIHDSVPARERWHCYYCRWLPEKAERIARARMWQKPEFA